MKQPKNIDPVHAAQLANAKRRLAALHRIVAEEDGQGGDSDGSGEASETPLGGSTEGDSAGPKDIAR